MVLTRLRAVPLTMVLLAALASCSTEEAAPVPDAASPSSSPSPSASTPSESESSLSADADVYVALGDSYTAAPLVPETDTTNGCLRSTGNYPSLVAKELPDTRLVDVSCSGADSAAMIGVQRTGDQTQAPQFEALTEDTDLVTLGIGGNDFGLFSTLVGVCTQARAADPEGSPCLDRLGPDGVDQVNDQLRQVQDRITAIATGIRDRAPDARVLVVGYPQIMPRTGGCPELLPLAAGDFEFARNFNEGLARALERGARAAEVEHVDVFAATNGHDICADEPWINGQTTDAGRALAYHPFAEEQQAVAELILEML